MKNAKWWLPILLMVLITPFTPWLDLTISHYFFSDHHFVSNDFTTFMFNYGILAADILVGGAVVTFLLSYCLKYWKPWRQASLVLILTLAIGAGFITHTLLKDHWGRPRPKQVIEFGGTQAFRPYYSPNFFSQPEPSKSFPCGHCTMGFYFFALALIGKRYHYRSLYYGGFALAVVLGIALSVTRIAMGGHFFSDTLISALIMWLTALACDFLIFGKEEALA